MTSSEKVELIRETADEAKAERIEILEVAKKTSMAEYFIVCTGNNERHLEAIADRVRDAMRIQKEKPLRIEGAKSNWILQDYGDVIFHVFREEQRQFYDIESFWNGMRTGQEPDPAQP